MVKTLPNSVIEIWSSSYINKLNTRFPEDENAQIIHCERGFNDDYIVEILREGGE